MNNCDECIDCRCPRCDGEGTIAGLSTCPLCNGTGTDEKCCDACARGEKPVRCCTCGLTCGFIPKTESPRVTICGECYKMLRRKRKARGWKF